MDAVRKSVDIPETDAWVTLHAAARELGEQRLTVLNRVVKGELVAQHIAGRTVISRASLDAFKKSRRPAKATR